MFTPGHFKINKGESSSYLIVTSLPFSNFSGTGVTHAWYYCFEEWDMKENCLENKPFASHLKSI